MANIAIVISETEGGLEAVAGTKYAIIPGTKTQFTALTTRPSPHFMTIGTIDTAEAGWVAFARKK